MEDVVQSIKEYVEQARKGKETSETTAYNKFQYLFSNLRYKYPDLVRV